ncbi:MAG: hypothetical protein H0T89_30990 [Deltaproteobacteria bacterium]|nr:hypothetical protein [Deltaproteobacteria bacterium]
MSDLPRDPRSGSASDPASDPTVHLGHLDEPCEVHEPASLDRILAFATIGSRVATFNHDIASKLQGLMMALDELTELLEAKRDPDLDRAAEAAQASLRDVNTLLTANRSLTRTTVRSRAALRDVIKHASAHLDIVVRGELPDAMLEVTLSLLQHGLGLAFDVAAGTGRGRSLTLETTLADSRIEISCATVSPPPAHAGDHLALAAFAIRHAGGELRCTADQHIVIRLPLA